MLWPLCPLPTSLLLARKSDLARLHRLFVTCTTRVCDMYISPLTLWVRLQVGCSDLLTRKALQLSGAARLARGTGAILNLQSQDTAQHLYGLPFHVPQLLFVPLTVCPSLAVCVCVLCSQCICNSSLQQAPQA